MKCDMNEAEQDKRTQVRMPAVIHKWLADRAKVNNRSLNGEMITIFQAEKAKEDEEQKTHKP